MKGRQGHRLMRRRLHSIALSNSLYARGLCHRHPEDLNVEAAYPTGNYFTWEELSTPAGPLWVTKTPPGFSFALITVS